MDSVIHLSMSINKPISQQTNEGFINSNKIPNNSSTHGSKAVGVNSLNSKDSILLGNRSGNSSGNASGIVSVNDSRKISRKMPHNNKPIKTHHFGCRVNIYDSGLIESRLPNLEGQNVEIINSCAVTHNASMEALKLAQKIKKNEPGKKVVLTGCAAQVDTKMFEDSKAVDLIVANSHKSDLHKILKTELTDSGVQQKLYKSNIFKKEVPDGEGGIKKDKSRSFLMIQDGCDSFCSFCVIPHARGKSRSLSVQELINKVKKLEVQGYKEVILSGIHIGDYLAEGLVLEDLVEGVLAHTKIPRIRLGSLEPIEITDRLLDAYQDSRMCSHVHVSVQSVQTDVLRAMKRKYTSEDVLDCFKRINNKLKSPFIGMDVIVGFPNETDEFFIETYNNLKSSSWSKIHVFPYSQRPKTKAMLLDFDYNEPDKKQRSRLLRELSSKRMHERAYANLNSVKNALVLQSGVQALTKDYWTLEIPKQEHLANKIIPIKITDLTPSKNLMDPKLIGSVFWDDQEAKSLNINNEQVEVSID